MRRLARTDRNHAAIVGALRAIGWYVIDLSRAGAGIPDLLCVRGGIVKLVEVKDGAKPASRRKLTAKQVELHGECQLAGVPVVILESVEQAVQL